MGGTERDGLLDPTTRSAAALLGTWATDRSSKLKNNAGCNCERMLPVNLYSKGSKPVNSPLGAEAPSASK